MMIGKNANSLTPRLFSRNRKIVVSRPTERGYDEQDPLNSIREYRIRKVASKRIPSRIS